MTRPFLISALLLMLSAAHALAFELDRVIAVINNEVITWGELYKEMERTLKAEITPLNEKKKAQFLKENEASFLEGMIDVKVQVQEAKRLGIYADGKEINETIDNIRKANSMSEEDFRVALEKEGLTLQKYRQLLLEDIMLRKVIDREVRGRILVTDEEIKQHIKDNASYSEDSYRLRQIFFRKPENESELSLIEDKADSVYARLLNGEDFQTMAMQISEDPQAKTGGDLGIIKKSELAPEFREQVKAMNAGNISKPFWGEEGLHILKLEEPIEGSQIEEIKRILIGNKMPSEHRQWLKQLRAKSFIEIRLY